jgi:hypothetical protein
MKRRFVKGLETDLALIVFLKVERRKGHGGRQSLPQRPTFYSVPLVRGEGV